MSIIKPRPPGYHGHRPPLHRQSLNYFEAEKNISYFAEDYVTYRRMKKLALCNKSDRLVQANKRIIKAGQLGASSACSIINPGALYLDDHFHLLCRGEPDESAWLGDFLAQQPTALWCTLDQDLNLVNSQALTAQGIPPKSRPEDWRLFMYQGKIYSNHSVYKLLDWDRWIVRSRVGISEVNLEDQTLNLLCLLEPPFEAAGEEKNWSFFVHKGTLMCIYSFRPYIILEVDLERGKTRKILEARPSFEWYEKGKFMGNSTNMISWDKKHYILFIHDFLEPKTGQRDRAYMQYGVLISKRTLLPTSIIPRPLIIGGDEQGRHPGVHYTSALVNRKDSLYAFYGEADSNTGTAIFNKKVLNEWFRKYRLRDEDSNIRSAQQVKEER